MRDLRKMGVPLYYGILFWNPSFGAPVSRSRFLACHGILGPARYMDFTQASVLCGLMVKISHQ